MLVQVMSGYFLLGLVSTGWDILGQFMAGKELLRELTAD